MFTETVTYPAALAAGILSFFSPCILPLIPAYMTFITGFSLDELAAQHDPRVRGRTLTATAVYVAGFSTVFILLGASASWLGGLMLQYRAAVRMVGGGVIVLLGLHLCGVVPIPMLQMERRLHPTRRPLRLVGTFLVGMAFGAGWSPCIGPLLGSILIIAGNQDTVGQGMVLLALYSTGLAVPFVLMAAAIGMTLPLLKRLKRLLGIVNWVAGGLLVAVGLLLMIGRLRL